MSAMQGAIDEAMLTPSICSHIWFCGYNYMLFIKLRWPGDREGTFRSSRQTVTCPSYTVEASRCLFNAERQARKL